MRRKLVVVLEGGSIEELNNIGGPIEHPTRIDLKSIGKMVQNKKNVLECDPSDPYNTEKRIKLTTMEQVTAVNFGTEKSPVQDKKEEAPVQKPEAPKPENKPAEPQKEEVKEPEVAKETPVQDKKEEEPVQKPEAPKPENNKNNKGNKKN